MMHSQAGIKVWTHADGRWVWWGSCECGARQTPAVPADRYSEATAWVDGHRSKIGA